MMRVDQVAARADAPGCGCGGGDDRDGRSVRRLEAGIDGSLDTLSRVEKAFGVPVRDPFVTVAAALERPATISSPLDVRCHRAGRL
jgi:hypothetical protein